MNKADQIAPWSFYRNEPSNQLNEGIANPIHKQFTNHYNVPHKKSIKKEIKNFKSINAENISKIQKIYQEKSLEQPHHMRSKSTIETYCPIINTSAQLIQTKQQTIELNQRLLILTIIKQELRAQNRQKQSKITRDKYQCLFPILKPRESLKTKKYKMIRNLEYPSQFLMNKLMSGVYGLSGV